MNCPGAAARRTSIAGVGAPRPARSARPSPPRRRRAAPRRRWRWWSRCRARHRAPAHGRRRRLRALSRSRCGAASLAPAVSAARSAKPSTLERSNGGTSIGAVTSCASTRPSAAASATRSAGSGARSTWRAKRARASSAETTSRNCSCRAARRIVVDQVVGLRRFCPSGRSWPRSYHDLASGRKTFAVGGHQNPAVGVARAAPAANSPRLWARPALRAGAPGRSPTSPMRRRDLARELATVDGSAASLLPASRSISGSPIVSQPAMAASIRPGSSSTGAVAGHAERRGLARRDRDAVRLDAAVRGERRARSRRCGRCRCRRWR